MGFENLFIDLGSSLEFHPEFFIVGDGEGLACGNGGRQRQGSLGAPSVDFYVIFSFDRSALFKVLDVIEL